METNYWLILALLFIPLVLFVAKIEKRKLLKLLAENDLYLDTAPNINKFMPLAGQRQTFIRPIHKKYMCTFDVLTFDWASRAGPKRTRVFSLPIDNKLPSFKMEPKQFFHSPGTITSGNDIFDKKFKLTFLDVVSDLDSTKIKNIFENEELQKYLLSNNFPKNIECNGINISYFTWGNGDISSRKSIKSLQAKFDWIEKFHNKYFGKK
tara:strand:+ start:15 stop:638 length:624 start_codon:yes stop_codon:yes gene_type:complete